MKYRKKPVTIEAVQFLNIESVLSEYPHWVNEAVFCGNLRLVDDYMEVRTLEDGPNGEAKHIGSPGDFLVKGVRNELYFCKPDIFKETYEAVDY